jgi:hypothetical protein
MKQKSRLAPLARMNTTVAVVTAKELLRHATSWSIPLLSVLMSYTEVAAMPLEETWMTGCWRSPNYLEARGF